MVALAMALVVFMAWAMAIVLAMALEAMMVMVVATSVPLSMDDTGHLDSSERPGHYFGIQNVCLIFIIYYFSSKTLSPCTWNFLDQQTLMFLMNDLNALPRYSQLCWKMTYILFFFTSVIFLDLLLNKYFLVNIKYQTLFLSTISKH